MEWIMDQSAVHFAAAPIFEELAEGVTMRMTALSEAIRLHKFQWVSFLLMVRSPITFNIHDNE